MIRKVTSSDYEELKKLVYQVHKLHYKNRPDIYIDGNPLPLEYFNEILNDENAFNYVYVEDNKILGLIIAKQKSNCAIPISKQRTTYFIEDIVVDKNSRRKGIGKMLYYFLKEQASKENTDAIELNVWAFNESAIKFYESLGMSVKNMKLEQILNKDYVEKINKKDSEIRITYKVGDDK